MTHDQHSTQHLFTTPGPPQASGLMGAEHDAGHTPGWHSRGHEHRGGAYSGDHGG
jgi:hypothetical protein